MGFVAPKMGGDKNELEEFFKPTPKTLGKMPRRPSSKPVNVVRNVVRKQPMGRKGN